MGSLTALKVKNAKQGRHGDGQGLYLVVSDTGARKWVLRVQAQGKRRDVGLGSAKLVSLAEAREAAQDMRKAFKRGENPLEDRKRARQTIPSFREAAQMVRDEHAPSWKNEKHAAQWLASLEAHAFPKLGDLPVNEIEGPLIRDVLAEIWLDIPETARRVRQRIGTVLDYAHAKGWRDAEAPMRSVSRGLPKQPKVKKHHSAMPWQEIPGFIKTMADNLKTNETVRLALELIILTASRSGEVRGATWQEFDLHDAIWTIPAKRMKAGVEHRVPLSPRAVEILRRMHQLRRTDSPEALVFEGQKPGKPMSDMTLTMALKRAGVSYTVHGFRSAFRDWCSEATDTPREVAEACLAHSVRNRTEAAYARTDHFSKRHTLMQNWSDFVDIPTSKTVPVFAGGRNG